MDEAAIAEHAYRWLCWLMERPESVVAVASHANFLLALHHACFDGCADAPQVFHTGELRVVAVSQRTDDCAPAPASHSAWAAQLTPSGGGRGVPLVGATPTAAEAI